MWSENNIQYKGQTYHYCIKHFDAPSVFGYNEGRASKIWIERSGKAVFNYDRGEDIAPADKDTEAVLQMLLEKYN